MPLDLREEREMPLDLENGRHRPWIEERNARLRLLILGLAYLLFVAVAGTRFVTTDEGNGLLLLLAVPIAITSLALGARAGVAMAFLGLLVFLAWDILQDVTVSPLAYITRGATFILLGGLVGRLAAAFGYTAGTEHASQDIDDDFDGDPNRTELAGACGVKNASDPSGGWKSVVAGAISDGYLEKEGLRHRVTADGKKLVGEEDF